MRFKVRKLSSNNDLGPFLKFPYMGVKTLHFEIIVTRHKTKRKMKYVLMMSKLTALHYVFLVKKKCEFRRYVNFQTANYSIKTD